MDALTPAFYVEVVMGGYPGQPGEWRYPRLTWHCQGGFSSGGMNSTVKQRQAKLGRYACHHVGKVGVAIPLIEPKVELSVELATELLEAFSHGAVRQEAVTAFAVAIRSAK